MEGVKSSPNNPGRQAIPLSSPYLPPSSLPSPLVPIPLRFQSLPLFLFFLFCIFSDSPTSPFPRSTWNHGGLTFIVSDNLPTKKRAAPFVEYATVSRLVSFWAVGGLVEDGHPPTTVKAPSRRGERKNRREPTTPRKSLFLIWDEDIGRWKRGDGREGLGLVPSSSFREELAFETSRYPIEHI